MLKITTKGRYALRIMIDLAKRQDEGFISLKQISERQGVSVKYLEMIAGVLNKAGLVQSLRGKHGGYKLALPPEACTAGTVLKLTEGDLAPVTCLAYGENKCERAARCETLPFWQGLDQVIDNYVESVTIADMMDREVLRSS